MTLRDKLYFRFFLFHTRYGRLWAALLEGVCIFISAVVIGLALFGLANLTMKAVDEVMERRADVYKKEAKGYQQMLVACLNGGIVGHTADGETVGCEGAVTFKLARIK